jgi:hypothetical protein
MACVMVSTYVAGDVSLKYMLCTCVSDYNSMGDTNSICMANGISMKHILRTCKRDRISTYWTMFLRYIADHNSMNTHSALTDAVVSLRKTNCNVHSWWYQHVPSKVQKEQLVQNSVLHDCTVDHVRVIVRAALCCRTSYIKGVAWPYVSMP